MLGQSPLNQYLHDQLKRRFGDVIIAHQGMAMLGHLVGRAGDKPKFQVTSPGEYYRVACPFCRQVGAYDTRHRLWINHRWGVGPDGVPDEKMWWACICYNEHCMERSGNVQTLRKWIYGGIGRERHPRAIIIRRGTTPVASLGIVDWPGRCLRVDQLQHDHEAYQYLISRDFDPQCLGKDWNVSFCVEASPEYRMASRRIVVPIFMNGEMVGWQARAPYDTDWRVARTPKYLNRPGMNKRLMLYGYDAAIGMNFVTIVEGVTDVWALGKGAVSLLGKDMSPEQAQLISSNWPAAVVALDPDAAEDRITKIRRQLPRDYPLVVVRLPDGVDPATVDQAFFWDLVLGEATRAGVDLLALANDPNTTP
jgi:hypothetical protein